MSTFRSLAVVEHMRDMEQFVSFVTDTQYPVFLKFHGRNWFAEMRAQFLFYVKIEEATLYLTKLPDLHKDPFDRLLICQSIVSGLIILTPDELITQYPLRSIW